MPRDTEEIRQKILDLLAEFDNARKKEEDFRPVEDPVLYNTDKIDERELKALFDRVLDLWWGVDEEAEKFEKELADFIGARHAVFTNSGSSANLLAVSSLRANTTENPLEKGDKVITPAATFPTTFNPLIQNDLTPIVVDVERKTYNIDVEKVREVADKAEAIIIPHMFGIPNRMDQITEIAEKNDLFIIEDTCDAFGSRYDGEMLGSFGDLATFSFYAAHHISTGEGGAVLTDNENLAKSVRSLRDWGRHPLDEEYNLSDSELPEDYSQRFVYSNIGYNLKPLDLQGAMGREQLKKAEKLKQKRQENYRFLKEIFEPYQDEIELPQPPEKSDVAWFCFPFSVKEDADFTRKELIEHLDEQNIHSRPLLAGNIARQPAYQDTNFRIHGELNNADFLAENGLFIGVHPNLTEEQRNHMKKTIKDFLGDQR